MSEYIKKIMVKAIEENKGKFDCTVCSHFEEGLAYYFCLDGGKHVIDDIVLICDEFKDKRNLGTRGKCELCKELFNIKVLIRIPYKKHEQKGFDKIFDTGYHYYCKKCKESM